MLTTWNRFPHTVDLLDKVVTINPAGQRVPNYAKKRTLPCFFVPLSARDRQGPTYENRNRDQLYIPPVDKNGVAIDLTYDMRFQNVKDRFGNLIRGDSANRASGSDNETYDIHMLIKHTGFSGKLRIYQVTVMTAVE